jgi:hypothetical protein
MKNDQDEDFEATEEDISPPVVNKKSNASQRVYKKLMKQATKPSIHISKADNEEADSNMYSMAQAEKDEDDPFADDYKDDELKDDLGSYKRQEKNAMSSPLRTKDMVGIEHEGASLMKEITGGMQGLADEDKGGKKFWQTKPFFRKHMGLA